MKVNCFEELRNKYRPDNVVLLLIGESAPDPGQKEQRFFYAPVLTAHDNLFRPVVEAAYGHRFPKGSAGLKKVRWLVRFRRDGGFLIDLVPYPVNRLSPPERERARHAHVSDTISKVKRLKPSGIVICHKPTFRVLDGPLAKLKLPLLHSQPIRFPLGNYRAEFVSAFREAVHGLTDWPQPEG